MKKTFLVTIVVLIQLFLCSPSKSDSPVGTYSYTNSAGWDYELNIYSSGSFTFRGPYGTTGGTWQGKSMNVTFYDSYGSEIGSGYVRSDDKFHYSGVYGGGERGSMVLSK